MYLCMWMQLLVFTLEVASCNEVTRDILIITGLKMTVDVVTKGKQKRTISDYLHAAGLGDY